MKRESGFYWVKYNGEWIVAKWNGFWFRTGVWKIDQDSDLEEIDERRIEREKYTLGIKTFDANGKLIEPNTFNNESH